MSEIDELTDEALAKIRAKEHQRGIDETMDKAIQALVDQAVRRGWLAGLREALDHARAEQEAGATLMEEANAHRDSYDTGYAMGYREACNHIAIRIAQSIERVQAEEAKA